MKTKCKWIAALLAATLFCPLCLTQALAAQPEQTTSAEKTEPSKLLADSPN